MIEERKKHDTRGKQRRAAMKRMGEENNQLREKVSSLENKLADVKQMLNSSIDQCATLTNANKKLKQTNTKLVNNVSRLESDLERLEADSRQHFEDSVAEASMRSNLEEDIVDLKKLIKKDRESNNNQTESDFGLSTSETDSNADDSEFCRSVDSDSCATLPESCIPQEKAKKKNVLADKSRKSGKQSPAPENQLKGSKKSPAGPRYSGKTAHNISLRSTRSAKLKLVYIRYSKTRGSHMIKLTSNFEETKKFTAYLGNDPFYSDSITPNGCKPVLLPRTVLEANPRAKYIRVEATSENAAVTERGFYATIQVPMNNGALNESLSNEH
ncbi:hypothetical protein FOL47_011237 [Perkinsus chesapeaki]|uniref:Uncharacterized protein n=1 Tax=Perkinsus chesapeaki TaxID=330153 RepID=A0A7J6KZ27_PERCH|nr:hypothetical protein FOL47_011237 [Perkinsus chesapeaki]